LDLDDFGYENAMAEAADAVLAAMREPDEDQLAAGVNGCGGVGYALESIDADNVRGIWQAMIDVARTRGED
jgi:hypothetical protein